MGDLFAQAGSSGYPGALDTFLSQFDKSPTLPFGADSWWAVKANNLAQGLVNIETELGLLPKGTYATVRARLDALDISSSSGVLSVNAGTLIANNVLTAGQVLYAAAGNTVGSSANLFWDAPNSRLGIGNTAPWDALTIGNAYDGAQRLSLPTGGVSDPAIRPIHSNGIQADTASGIYWNASASLFLKTNNEISLMRGTYNPITFSMGDSATAATQVNFNNGVLTATAGTQTNFYWPTTFSPTSGTPTDISFNIAPTINWGGTPGAGSYEALRISAVETAIPTGTNYLIRAMAGPGGTTDRFVVTNTGNVGIGTTTPINELLTLKNAGWIGAVNATGTGSQKIISLNASNLIALGAARTAAAVAGNFAANFYIRLQDVNGAEFYVPAMNAEW